MMHYTEEELNEIKGEYVGVIYQWQDKAKKLEDTRSSLIFVLVIISIVAVLAGYFAIKTSVEYDKYRKEAVSDYNELIESSLDYSRALKDIRAKTLPNIDTRFDCTKVKLNSSVESCKYHNEIVGEVIANPDKYLP